MKKIIIKQIMKINNEKKKNWTPFAPNLGGVLVPRRNAPIPEDTF